LGQIKDERDKFLIELTSLKQVSSGFKEEADELKQELTGIKEQLFQMTAEKNSFFNESTAKICELRR